MAVPSGFCGRKNLWLVSLLISRYMISQIRRNSFTDCCTRNFNKQTKLFGSRKQSIILVVYYDYIYHKNNFFETRRNIAPWLQWMEQQNFRCFHSKPPRWDSYVVWALKMKQSRYDSVASSFLFICSCTLVCLRGGNHECVMLIWVFSYDITFFS